MRHILRAIFFKILLLTLYIYFFRIFFAWAICRESANYSILIEHALIYFQATVPNEIADCNIDEDLCVYKIGEQRFK